MLNANSSAAVVLNIHLLEDAHENATALIFTITAQSANNADINNFIEIEVLATTQSMPVLNNTEIVYVLPTTVALPTTTETSVRIHHM